MPKHLFILLAIALAFFATGYVGVVYRSVHQVMVAYAH